MLGRRAGIGALALGLTVFAPFLTRAEDAGPGEERFLSRVRQLTFDGLRAGEGYYSPDGRLLVFQSEREEGNPFYQIYELDLESGETRRVSPGHGKTTCAFIRPGNLDILFASTHHDPESARLQREELELRASGKERRYAWDYDTEMELYVAPRRGGAPQRLTHARGYDAEASYSPDGRWIVFSSNRRAYEGELTDAERKKLEVDPSYFLDLYVMPADGGQPRRITDAPGYDGGPFFTADGERIVWRRFDEEGLTADVMTARMDGSDARRLTDFKAMSWAPYAHPSGEYVIFTSNKLGFSNFELFLVDMAGKKEPVQITTTDGFDGLPVFSPDGGTLTWTTNRKGSSQLFNARWNHEAAQAAVAAAPLRGEGGDAGSSRPVAGSTSRTGPARTRPDVSAIRATVSRLADPALAGRMTGSEGARLAADHIVEQLTELGVRPLPGQTDLRIPFDFTAGVDDTGSTLATGSGGPRWATAEDVRGLSFSDVGEITAPVVFAGYGLKLPDDSEFPYDSFHGLDLEGKIAVILRYYPEDVDQETRALLARYSGLRYKALAARERGAKAVLFVAGPNSPNAGKTIGLSFDAALAGSGILAASISGDVADALFQRVEGKTLADVQTSLDSGNPHVAGFDLPDVELTLNVKIKRRRETGYNVVGWWPGDTDSGAVMVGAHYDHLGTGSVGNSLARKDEQGKPHVGADDNASGVATVLDIARQTAPESGRPVVFAFWSGEELGTLGSSAFSKQLEETGWDVDAYLNFDMVGRLSANGLALQAVGSSDVWTGLIERLNVSAGLDLSLQQDPYLPTDSIVFYQQEIATLNFFTGSHEDYHRPSDTADKIDVDGIGEISRFGARMLARLRASEEDPGWIQVARSNDGGSRDSLRAFTGTIPDYTSEAEGLTLSGVIGGGPAEEAGLQGGDVIVEFGGQKITNIYDYTYALDAVKIGEPLQVVFVRDGERHTVTLTPRARD